MSLLTDIETAAVDSTVPLADLLRKCKVLAARLKHQEFSDWVTQELNGYDEEDALPDYRRHARGPSFGHFAGPFGAAQKNVVIPSALVPESIRTVVMTITYLDSVGALHAMMTSAAEKGALTWKWPGNFIVLMQQKAEIYPGYVLVDAWSPLPPGQIAGILDTVRSRVLDYVLAIQKENPEAGESAPNAPPPIAPGILHATYNMTIYGMANVGNAGAASIGDGNAVSVGNTQNNGVGDSTIQQLLAELRSSVSAVESADDRAEAEGALQKVEVQLAKPKPDLERIKNYLGIIQTIATIAAPTVEKLATYLGPYIAGLLG